MWMSLFGIASVAALGLSVAAILLQRSADTAHYR
jgi:hypothetical protein